ncbi:hypothetical protein [Kribbella soli]|uniref:Uncharacterized protein n=1 Tax=Kribbella soli TaxID=1124743 RepID=A0A4R0H0E6_9ACTN|nr:hypothetical protein [Kribbella soli]TCC02634.1 hypothetical protein E0H45_36985 [Kribbella soli]
MALDHDNYRLDHLQLPAHVHVRIRGEWRSGWLIGCDRQLSGWHGLVQYQDDDEDQPETTTWLRAEDIAADGGG